MVIKILMDAPAWIGDMVMAQTLFKRIKHHDPDAIIDVLAPSWAVALLARMPEVARVWVSPFAHGELRLRERYRFAKKLRREGYDWAIVLRNSWKSALIPYWARIPRRTGWLGEARYFLLNDWRKLDKARYPLMIERFMALALAPGAPLSQPYPHPQLTVTPFSVQETCAALSIRAPTTPLLIVCPGAEYGPAKRWPADYFAIVAQEKLQQGWQVWLMGSAKERAITQKINERCEGRCLDFAGRTTLGQAVDLLSLATAVVCNDSGLMHVAAALDVPVVVLYGSSSSKFTPPLSEKVKMLSLNLSCSPCFKRECPLQHLNCLKQLLPTQVLQAMNAG